MLLPTPNIIHQNLPYSPRKKNSIHMDQLVVLVILTMTLYLWGIKGLEVSSHLRKATKLES